MEAIINYLNYYQDEKEIEFNKLGTNVSATVSREELIKAYNEGSNLVVADIMNGNVYANTEEIDLTNFQLLTSVAIWED